MKGTIYNSNAIIRIDRGENLIESLCAFCEQNQIQCATVSGIGAIDSFTCGVFNVETKEYKEIQFDGAFEILSLTGNITSMNGQPYVHLHITAGDKCGRCFGGHLKEARISATCEIVLNLINATINRVYDRATGLNLLDI